MMSHEAFTPKAAAVKQALSHCLRCMISRALAPLRRRPEARNTALANICGAELRTMVLCATFASAELVFKQTCTVQCRARCTALQSNAPTS